jgi:hypothetical protein
MLLLKTLNAQTWLSGLLLSLSVLDSHHFYYEICGLYSDPNITVALRMAATFYRIGIFAQWAPVLHIVVMTSATISYTANAAK